MNRRARRVAVVVAVLCATGGCATGSKNSASPASESAVAWFDTRGDVHVIRNPATMSDAALHRGTFSIGPDDCLYVTVVDDNGTVAYLAAVLSTTRVSRESVSQDEATFPIGAEATFTHTEMVGDVPSEALAACTGATTAYGAIPAGP